MRKARDGRLPRALPFALPAWGICHRAGCDALAVAIVVPRDGRCSQGSGRWYVPTNEEKTPCVDFIQVPTSIFSVRGAMQSDSLGYPGLLVPLARKIDGFSHIFIWRARPSHFCQRIKRQFSRPALRSSSGFCLSRREGNCKVFGSTTRRTTVSD